MACIELPAVSLPTLPAPFTIDPPAIPSLSVDPSLCCKLPTLNVSIPIPLGPAVINPGVIATINAMVQVINSYIDALPLNCPFEG